MDEFDVPKEEVSIPEETLDWGKIKVAREDFKTAERRLTNASFTLDNIKDWQYEIVGTFRTAKSHVDALTANIQLKTAEIKSEREKEVVRRAMAKNVVPLWYLRLEEERRRMWEELASWNGLRLRYMMLAYKKATDLIDEIKKQQISAEVVKATKEMSVEYKEHIVELIKQMKEFYSEEIEGLKSQFNTLRTLVELKNPDITRQYDKINKEITRQNQGFTRDLIPERAREQLETFFEEEIPENKRPEENWIQYIERLSTLYNFEEKTPEEAYEEILKATNNKINVTKDYFKRAFNTWKNLVKGRNETKNTSRKKHR